MNRIQGFFTKEIKNAVDELNINKEWRHQKMTLQMKEQEKYDEGFYNGENVFASLVQILVQNKRMSDIEKASMGKAYREKLYAEFHLN